MSKKNNNRVAAAGPSSVDWNQNVRDFDQLNDVGDKMFEKSMLLALWSNQLETADAANPALAFVRAMQISMQHANVLCALALYRPVASALSSTFALSGC
jgi:hypothetical protein